MLKRSRQSGHGNSNQEPRTESPLPFTFSSKSHFTPIKVLSSGRSLKADSLNNRFVNTEIIQNDVLAGPVDLFPTPGLSRRDPQLPQPIFGLHGFVGARVALHHVTQG